MKLSDDVKTLAISMGVDLVGIAPVERFDYAPEKFKPQYFMRDAKCVVVLATRILQGISDVHGAYNEEGKTIGPYSWFGYPILNWGNSWTVIQVGKHLEDNGYKALPFAPAGFHYQQADKGLPDFLHKHAAVAAGLGEFGLNRLFISPRFGPRQRIISIITNAPLESDPMYNGPKLCNREECGDACVKICPMQAFVDKLMSVRIGDKVYQYLELDSIVCHWCAIVGKYLRGTDELPRYPDRKQIDELYERAGGRANVQAKMNPIDKTFQQFTWTPTCGACLVKCSAPWK